MTARAPAPRIAAIRASQSSGAPKGEWNETTTRRRSENCEASESKPLECSTSTVAPASYASSVLRLYSSGEPENLPPSAAVLQVASTGRASSSCRRATGIASSQRSRRYSTAEAFSGTRASRRRASSRSRGAIDATKAGLGRSLSFKTKTPDPFGSEVLFCVASSPVRTDSAGRASPYRSSSRQRQSAAKHGVACMQRGSLRPRSRGCQGGTGRRRRARLARRRRGGRGFRGAGFEGKREDEGGPAVSDRAGKL